MYLYMKTKITKKIVACLLALFVLTTLFSSFEPVFADNTDTIKGNPVTITDPVTGVHIIMSILTDRSLFIHIRAKTHGQVTVRVFCAV